GAVVADRVNLLGLPRAELEAFVAGRLDAKPFRARQLMKWIYRRGAADFCATARQGFNRNLSVAEIVGQVWLAHRELAQNGAAARADGRSITNIVFMGMGEPLANYRN